MITGEKNLGDNHVPFDLIAFRCLLIEPSILSYVSASLHRHKDEYHTFKTKTFLKNVMNVKNVVNRYRGADILCKTWFLTWKKTLFLYRRWYTILFSSPKLNLCDDNLIKWKFWEIHKLISVYWVNTEQISMFWCNIKCCLLKGKANFTLGLDSLFKYAVLTHILWLIHHRMSDECWCTGTMLSEILIHIFTKVSLILNLAFCLALSFKS